MPYLWLGMKNNNHDELEAFIKAIEVGLPGEIDTKEICELMELFLCLHEQVNDPSNRETQAEVKAHLIQDIAMCQLGQRLVKDYFLELISAVHEETGTKTHNVIVTFGDPKTGPSTFVEVHHDTIAAGDYKLKFDQVTQCLLGRTIQDNTIHLAATLQALKNIIVPSQGSIVVVFTDFEENGCRGSGALKEDLASRINPSFPVALIALESTGGKLAIGHRGKFSGEVVGKLSGRGVVGTFTDFYQMLNSVQHRVYDADNCGSVLGHTTGTSTCGEVGLDTDMWCKLDVRTNDVTTPEFVKIFLRKLLMENGCVQMNSCFKRHSRFWIKDIGRFLFKKMALL
jgi:hypothetical protein